MDSNNTNNGSQTIPTTSTATLAGQIARGIHTGITSLLLLSSLYSVYQPLSEGTDCAVRPIFEADDGNATISDQHEYAGEFIKGLIQLVNWWGVGFFLYCFLGDSVIQSAGLLVIFLSGACYINHHFITVMLQKSHDPYQVPQECFDGLVSFVVVVCSIEAVVLLLLLYDARQRQKMQQAMLQNESSTTATEATGLVVY